MPLNYPFLKDIHVLSRKSKLKIYLVGGILRDLALKRKKESLDFDFAVSSKALKFAHRLSKRLKGNYVVLDRLHGCARVIFKHKNKTYTLDFTDFRDKDLRRDLLKRDFSINTIALDLENIVKGKYDIIDYYGAKEDLKNRIIRVVSTMSLRLDPLRIMRAFSLAAQLNFKIDKDTLKEIKKSKKNLSKSAAERIREELFKILDVPDSNHTLRQMDELSVLSEVMPEIKIMRGVKQGPYHHLDVWNHSLEALSQLEIYLKKARQNPDIKNYLNGYISGTHRREQLIKLGALLHDIGKPGALERKDGKTRFHGHERVGLPFVESICERLKLSTREIEALKYMVFWHLRPGYLADNEPVTPRAIFRYFRDTKDEGVSILLISIADQRATRGPLTTLESRQRHEKTVAWLIKEFFRRKKEKKLPRLITGDDLIKKLKLTPSPIFSKILRGIEEAQALKKIKTKKQALEFAAKIGKSARR